MLNIPSRVLLPISAHASTLSAQVSEFILGKPTREGGYGLETLVAGPVVYEMGEAVDAAAAGQLVIASSAAQLRPDASATVALGISATADTLPDGSIRFMDVEGIAHRFDLSPSARGARKSAFPHKAPRGDGAAPAEGGLGGASTFWREFLPEVLRNQLPASGEHYSGGTARQLFLSEHRTLSAISLRLHGLGRGRCDIDDTRAAQQAVLTVQEVVAHYRGAICRLITDDKGTRFIIACGLPGFAAEHDANAHSLHAWRALQIALHCHAALTSQGLDCSAGVSTGRMFCGEAGSSRLRAEYTLHGSRVNLCARLMTLASKESRPLLCDSATQAAVKQTRPNAIFREALAPIRLKGFSEPVACLEPVDALDTSSDLADAAQRMSTRASTRLSRRVPLQRTSTAASGLSASSAGVEAEGDAQGDDGGSDDGALFGRDAEATPSLFTTAAQARMRTISTPPS